MIRHEWVYTGATILGEQDPDSWHVEFSRELHLTGDAERLVGRDAAENDGYEENSLGVWVHQDRESLHPVFEGRMVGQFDPAQKAWLKGKGRGAVWEKTSFEKKRVLPQFLIRQTASHPKFAIPRIAVMDVTRSTVSRTAVANLIVRATTVHSAPTMMAGVGGFQGTLALLCLLNSLPFDWVVKKRCSGLHLSFFVIEETPLPMPDTFHSSMRNVSKLVARLSMCSDRFAPEWLQLGLREDYSRRWAITPHERLRLRTMLDAIVAVLYGLERDDFAWILKDCDHPAACLSDRAFCRQLDPKGFWRVDKTTDPELRHTVLTLSAFDGLQAAIAAAGGDRDSGIKAFCDQHDGDGWMLPETLCIADLGLTRTVDVGAYDDRARRAQPVRSRMGPRFLDWQLEQSVEESWAECERHAKAILEGTPAPPAPSSPATTQKKPDPQQQKLF